MDTVVVAALNKTTSQLLWDQIELLKPGELGFKDAIKWSRSLMRYIKKKSIDRYQIEKALELLDLLVKRMTHCINFGGSDEYEITDTDRATFFDIVLSIGEIQDKYDRKSEIKNAKNKLTNKLKALETKINAD